MSPPVAPNSPRTRSVVSGERKQVTVLVAGLKGVPALAQAVDAEVLYDLLNRASTLIREEIQRLDGLVIQGPGEHLTALFGAPMAHEDHAIRALHAALGIQQAFVAYADELQRTSAITLDVGVGMHTGPLVVGTFDNDAGPSYSAQGFAIYLAERLQALATGGAICISAAVQQETAGFFRFDDRGACTLPDIAQPVHISTCTGAAQGTSRLEAFLHCYRSQFLGRERDMDLLGTLWARVRRGQGQVVVLFGEAGVGKSRLAADEPLLAHLLGVPLEPDQLPTLPPEEQKRRLQHACLQVILQHAAEQPLCLLIEDLHWLDNSSQELLDLVVTSSARRPVLLLGTARPGFRDTWADRSYFHRLTVAPLSDEHTDTFIYNYFRPHDASVTPQSPHPHAHGRQSVLCGGDAAYLAGTYAYRVAGRRVCLETGRAPGHSRFRPWGFGGPYRSVAIRGQAPPAERCGAWRRSVCPLLDARAELPDEALHRGLSHLQAAELLYETGRFPEQVYTFKHALTHEVAYAGLRRDRRRALHACIVEAIETRYADCFIDQVESLAHHAFQGEVWGGR